MNEILLKNYVASNDIFGYPQSYRGIDFYPIRVKDVKYISAFYNIFTYPKNFTTDKKIIKMSYLKFIIGQSQDPYKMIESIEEFLKYITNRNVEILNNSSEENVDIYNIAFKIIIYGKDMSDVGYIEFFENDFDDIREIILEQNGLSIEYVNQYHPDLEKALYKFHKNSTIDFSDEIFTVAVLMNKTLLEIGEYTLFQLQNIVERLVILKNYDLYQPLIVSGQIELKDKKGIKSYFYHKKKKQRYDDISMSTDEFIENSQNMLKT